MVRHADVDAIVVDDRRGVADLLMELGRTAGRPCQPRDDRRLPDHRAGRGVEREQPPFAEARAEAGIGGAENDRVPRELESYVKDFKPLRLGEIELKQGRGLLTLRALSIAGKQVMDVRAVVLTLVR